MPQSRPRLIKFWTEYMRANDLTVDTKLFSKKKLDFLMKHFNSYLKCGGFPEVTNYDDDVRIKTLQEYIDVAIYRDIIERYGVKHPSLIKYMTVFILTSISRSFSINKFYNHYLDLRRQNCKVYYYLTKDRYEVDFLAQTIQGKEKLIQVCWDTSDSKTLQREEKALEAAKKELKIDGEIITLDKYLREGVVLS